METSSNQKPAKRKRTFSSENGREVLKEGPIERPKSPYMRRFPFRDRLRWRSKSITALNTPNSSIISRKSSFISFHSSNNSEIMEIQDDQLPIEVHSRRSLNYLRYKRNPKHNGNRAIKQQRSIKKSGLLNATLLFIPQKSYRFLKDIVTTLIEQQWRFVLIAFSMSFFSSWIIFSILWYLIASAHGDLDTYESLTNETHPNNTWRPCVEGTKAFSGFLLLSIETQVTTGYGLRHPTEECPEAIFLMIIQLITGVFIDGAMIGIVYVKLSRSDKRAEVKFSRKAVICQRNGKLCFIFRICDVKQAHVIDTRVQAVMIENRRSLENEDLKQWQYRMQLENNGNILLMWPITICHEINPSSPLFNLSAKDLLDKRFEIAVSLTGGSWVTGQRTQARTSYLANEILWGHRFVNMMHYDNNEDYFLVTLENFDTVEAVDTPLCSAKRLEEILTDIQETLEFETNDEYFVNE